MFTNPFAITGKQVLVLLCRTLVTTDPLQHLPALLVPLRRLPRPHRPRLDPQLQR